MYGQSKVYFFNTSFFKSEQNKENISNNNYQDPFVKEQ